MIRKLLCRIGYHGPNVHGDEWGRCGEPLVRQCPHCGMRWYGDVVNYLGFSIAGDWKTRAQCIKGGVWAGDKYPDQKY